MTISGRESLINLINDKFKGIGCYFVVIYVKTRPLLDIVFKDKLGLKRNRHEKVVYSVKKEMLLTLTIRNLKLNC